MKYTPALDGFRALSILIVMLSHVGLGHLVPGGLGVTIFFFISGYLITSLLVAEADKYGFVDLRKFYIRRFWRLLPPAIFFIIAASLLVLFINKSINYKEILAAAFYFANYYKIFFHFDNVASFLSPFVILWSLAIEEHFYILFAPMLALTYKSKVYFKVILAFLVIPLFIRLMIALLLPESIHEGGYTYSATETRIDSIAFGCYLACLVNNVVSGRVSILDKVLSTKYFVLGIGGLLVSLLIRDIYFRETVRYTLQNISLFFVISNILLNNGLLFTRIRSLLSTDLLTFIGKLSYSLYLQHWLAITIVSYCLSFSPASIRWQLSFWCLTVFLTLFSYYVIEQPTLRYRRKYGSNV